MQDRKKWSSSAKELMKKFMPGGEYNENKEGVETAFRKHYQNYKNWKAYRIKFVSYDEGLYKQ